MKAFAVLIIVTIAIGGGIGGAIIMATGSGSDDNAIHVVTTQENFPTPTRSQAVSYTHLTQTTILHV